MKEKYKLTLEFVNYIFYEINGIVFRKDEKPCSNNTKSGGGYKNITYKGKIYPLHRILYILYNQTEIPENYFIDHIDNDRGNNSKDNLRIANRSENQHNRKINSNNSTGLKGISIRKDKGYVYYYCRIMIENKEIFKAFPYTPEGFESAKIWIESKRQELHKEFARHH